MTPDQFKFLWRHFHCNTVTDEDIDAEVGITDDENADELMEGAPERIFQDQERIVCDQELGNRNKGEMSDDKEENEEEKEKKKVWYHKVEPIVDHFCDKSAGLVHTLGTLLSFNEMMI